MYKRDLNQIWPSLSDTVEDTAKEKPDCEFAFLRQTMVTEQNKSNDIERIRYKSLYYNLIGYDKIVKLRKKEIEVICLVLRTRMNSTDFSFNLNVNQRPKRIFSLSQHLNLFEEVLHWRGRDIQAYL